MSEIKTVRIAITGHKLLIFCLESFLSKHGAEVLIKAAFPRFTRKNFVEYEDYRVCYDYETHSSDFDQAIAACEKENNWSENPCIAMRIRKEKEETLCCYQPFTV